MVLDFLKKAYRKGLRKVNSSDWKSFCDKLKTSSVSAEEANAIGFWTIENLACHNPSRMQPRSLQEFEERIFPGAVHSELVEAVQFGMVSELQCENILEEFLENSSQAVLPDKMLSSLSDVWSRDIQGFRSIKVS